MSALVRLADEKYLLLTTFRKDGRAVATPVWAVRDGDASNADPLGRTVPRFTHRALATLMTSCRSE